jgi:hypothetical protein
MVDQPPPKKYCDLIMKGGVTSGVVYPLAVCELASEYWFKNIGGTSAGAIAAGITAAAECGRRRSGSDAGFKQLARLPDDLKQENFLASLFKPDPDTKKVFEVVLAAMTAKQAHRSVKTAVVLKLCRNFSESDTHDGTLVPRARERCSLCASGHAGRRAFGRISGCSFGFTGNKNLLAS